MSGPNGVPNVTAYLGVQFTGRFCVSRKSVGTAAPSSRWTADLRVAVLALSLYPK